VLTKIHPPVSSRNECPACGGDDASAVYRYETKDGDACIFRCSRCTCRFLRPLVLAEVEVRKMESICDAELYTPLYKTLHERFLLKREERILRRLLATGNQRLLDVGCGTGWTTSFWASNGFDVTGLEPSQERSALAKSRYGFRVINGFLEDLDISEKFDVIMFRQVLEHFEEPATMLSKAIRLLADGGIVLVVVPNIDSIGRYLFDTDWKWVLPWHCTFFNPASLRAIGKRVGLLPEVLYQTPSPLCYSYGMTSRFPSSAIVRRAAAHGPGSLLLWLPVMAAGILAGHGDNLTMFFRRQ